MTRTLIAALLLAGCGIPEEPPASPERSAGSLAASSSRTFDVAYVREQNYARRNIAPRPAGLDVAVSALPASGRLIALAGMIGCGFWEIGRSQSDIAAGAADLELALGEGASGPGFDLFFFVDEGNDGQCTTEQVFQAPLPDLPASGVRVDASAAQASYGGCWLFN
jgi:hypothetical protein